MNLKKSVLSFMAAGAILAGGFGGAAAQSATGTGNGSVYINDNGTFGVALCEAVIFNPVTINSTNPTGTSTGNLKICYTDTQADRGAFRTTLKAGPFYGPTDNFAATNVEPTTMYNVVQGQCGGPGSNACQTAIDIGDIGAFNGTSQTYQSGAYITSGSGQWHGGDLSTAKYVNYAWPGVGTGNANATEAWLQAGSYSPMDLKLTVPAGLDGGTYTSTFTITVSPGNP